jgi:DNA-binding response OmpR family regulator
MAKIQIIDDEVDLAGNLKILLENSGHTAFTHNAIEGAVEEILKNAPDILLLDVMFPGNPSGGFEIARAVRENDGLKKLPIIMLTGVNQEMPLDFSSKDIDSDWMPVQDFMDKPVDMTKLIEAIDSLLKS